jgi:hypothetical protein
LVDNIKHLYQGNHLNYLVCACGFNLEMDPEGKLLMNRYEFRKPLGQGNFAKVYKARDLRTGDPSMRSSWPSKSKPT